MGGYFALAVLCTLPFSAMAQEGSQAALELRPAIDGSEIEAELSTEELAIIEMALAQSTSFASAPVKPLRLPALPTAKGLDL